MTVAKDNLKRQENEKKALDEEIKNIEIKHEQKIQFKNHKIAFINLKKLTYNKIA